MNKDIFLTNSLGNEKVKFNPINPKKIGMYVSLTLEKELQTKDKFMKLSTWLHFGDYL